MNLSRRRAIQREFTEICGNYAGVVQTRGKREARKLAEWIRPHANDTVLDAACGPGLLARELAGYSNHVVGIDLCLSMIQSGIQTHTRTPCQSAFAVADIEQLPFPTGGFDLLTCTYSFANFPKPVKILKEFCRVTRSGGRIAVAEVIAPEDPAACDFVNRLESLRSRIYTRVLTRIEFLRLFQAAGLELEAFHFQWRHIRFRDWLRLAPAGSVSGRFHRLRKTVQDMIQNNYAELHPRRIHGELSFSHQTAWFLLRCHSS